MILVMNKKGGVGCTTIAFNISRLLNKPLLVNSDSFLLEDIGFPYIEPPIKKITAKQVDGVYDIGTRVEGPLVKKFIKATKLILIPMELGYESVIKTAETIKYIRSVRKRPPIIIVLNRLNNGDSDRDFNYKLEIINKLQELNIDVYQNTIDFIDVHQNTIDVNEESKVTLTYLRNSYTLFDGYEDGKYFLDNYKRSDYDDAKSRMGSKKDFDIRFLNYLAYIEFENVDYNDDEIYRQDKDMVLFRENFKNKYNDKSFSGFQAYDKIYLDNNKKLIKDIAYILYAIRYYIEPIKSN